MFDWGTFRERKEFYQGAFGDTYHFDHDHHHVHVRARELTRTLQVLRFDMGFILLNDIVVTKVVDHPRYQHHRPAVEYDVTYHLFHLEAHQRLQVHLLLSKGEELPSVGQWFVGATRLEKEARIKLGFAQWDDSPLEMPSFARNPNLSEAPYPQELHQWYLFGLSHPLTRNQWALAVEASLGLVQEAWLKTGYWRRDWENQAIGQTPMAVKSMLMGLEPEAALLTDAAWVKTVEDYFLWRIPERAQAVRMLCMELGRISHHLSVLGRLAQELKISEAASVCREMRERIRFLCGFLTGERVMAEISEPGGLARDIPAGWVAEATSFMRSLEAGVLLYSRLVTRHPTALRTLKVAGIAAQDALAMGLTGPTLRAAGVNFDLRKSRPFYFYQDIDFDVPVGVQGDAHDRMLILLEECRQSLRILWQVIDNLPLGAFRMELDGLSEFNAGTLAKETWLEWLKAADRTWGAQYTAVEGVNGELGFHLVFHPERPVVWGLKIKTNAVLLAEAMPQFLNGCPVADLSVAISTLNLMAAAVDR